MELNDLVEVKVGFYQGRRGRIREKIERNRPIYMVEFPDGRVGFFDERKLEKIEPSPRR